MNRVLSIAVLLPLVGCGTVEESPELLLPEPIPVAWEEAYDAEADGLGALVPVELMAYDGATGEPLASVPLVVYAPEGSVWPVEADEVVVVDPDDCYGCDLLWDAHRDEFVLAPRFSDPLLLRTDDDGMARMYLYVDSFPASTTEPFGDLVVVVEMNSGEQSFLLLPR